MGRTYVPRNKKAEGNLPDSCEFDVNFAGADILGCIMKAVGEHSLSIEKRNERFGPDSGLFPSTKVKLSKEECLKAAAAIRELPDEVMNPIAERCRSLLDDEGSGDVGLLKEFAYEWATWLEECEGYEVLG